MASQSLILIADLLETYEIKFKIEPPDRLKCILCKHVLKNAKQTSCGCKVCEKCINTYLKEGEKPCPSKQPDCAETKLMLHRDIHQDNATNREIANLTAKCPFGSCTVIDSLKMILSHVDECEYREMTCDKCGSKYSWKDKDKHAKEECNQRIVKCPHCHKEMTALQTEHLRDHLKNCTNKKVVRRKQNKRNQKRMEKPLTLMSEGNFILENVSLTWKISDFENLINDAETGKNTSVTSDPFYTEEGGYKMCLQIYPYGDGIGRSTHLSVFFAIMKGEYDDVLTWPFKQKVTLTLFDQENYGAKHHSDTFKPDARSECYQKPIDDCNIALGSPKFIPLRNLLNNSPYCKNGTIFLKIAVDTINKQN